MKALGDREGFGISEYSQVRALQVPRRWRSKLNEKALDVANQMMAARDARVNSGRNVGLTDGFGNGQ